MYVGVKQACKNFVNPWESTQWRTLILKRKKLSEYRIQMFML